jgi:peroxiredoxin Q/BCP
MITINQAAPDFSLPDQDGKTHRLSDHRGKWVLVYFYPKDGTSGCTKEACSIRDSFPEFKKLNLTIFGVSVDSVESHEEFSKKYSLPFTILSDSSHEVVKAYGVWAKKQYMGKEYEGTVRTSFLINPEGVVVKVYQNVNPDIHAEEVLKDVTTLQASH